MAISLFSGSGSVRKRILYFGEAPSEEDRKSFIDLDFLIEVGSDDSVSRPELLSSVDSVIISQNVKKHRAVAQDIIKFSNTLLDHDCRVYIRVATNENLNQAAREFVIKTTLENNLPVAGLTQSEKSKFGPTSKQQEGNPHAPYIYICDTSVGWKGIAKLIGYNRASHGPSQETSLSVFDDEGNRLNLEVSDEVLLRRAFWDCTNVHLTRLPGGLSGVAAYRAYVRLSSGVLGLDAAPYPYFVKLGDRNKIEREYTQYRDLVVEYIPSHLAPRLRHERCALGATRGVIVGDFVEGSEPLKTCANDGRASAAVANLFGKTLRTWQSYGRKVEESVPEFLRTHNFHFPDELPQNRIGLVSQLGSTKTLMELKALYEKLDSKPILIGPGHGDLHAANILVRGADAVLIDFEKARQDIPFVFDLASLESGLFVDGFLKDKRSHKEILCSVIGLYDGGKDQCRTLPCKPEDPSVWYFECIRQIRLHARELEQASGQYAAALVFTFLKKACNSDIIGEEQIALRACAFILAEKILTSETGSAKI